MEYDQNISREKMGHINVLTRHETVPSDSAMLPVSYRQTTNSNNYPPVETFGRSDVATAVQEFHAAFNLPHQTLPSINVEKSLEELRISLLQEEVSELISAVKIHDLVGIADALADITYVVYGTALTYGIDLDRVLSEVHRSNMSKLDHSGKPIIRADGKVLKSERYSPPDVAAVLQYQAVRFETTTT